MKKLLISVILCCVAICGFAQEHLSFKGIPIEDSITAFCQKLSAKGFTQISSDRNIRLFTGDFTGRQATVGAVAADNGKDVYAVAVFFDNSDSWNDLVNTYEHYKDLYTEKYGNPTQCVENNPGVSGSNISQMYELNQGSATYACLFEAPGGTIQISIEKSHIQEGFVMIKYQDAQNISAKRQKDLDEI